MNIWHVDRFPWHTALTVVAISFYIFFPTSVYIVKNMYIFTYTDCLEIVYELLMLPQLRSYLNKKVAAPGLDNRDSSTGGGCSVGIVRSRTKATELESLQNFVQLRTIPGVLYYSWSIVLQKFCFRGT